MKAFLRHIILFTLAFIPFYIGACIIWGEIIPPNFSGNLKYKRGGHGHTLARTTEAKTVKHPDILFLGSSHCFRGFDPRIFAASGYSIFNLGTNAQTPRQTEIIFKRYLNKIQPRLVVIEIYPELFEQEGIESMLDLLANDTLDRDIIEQTFEIGNYKLFHTLGFAWYKQCVARNAEKNQSYLGFGDEYISGGFCQQINQSYKGMTHFKKLRWTPIQTQTEAIERIIETCRKEKIEIILVQSPIHRPLYDSRVDNEKIDMYFQSKGLYFNYNNKMEFANKALFFDEHHLNESGVKLFDQLFIEDLLKSGLIKKDK